MHMHPYDDMNDDDDDQGRQKSVVDDDDDNNNGDETGGGWSQGRTEWVDGAGGLQWWQQLGGGCL